MTVFSSNLAVQIGLLADHCDQYDTGKFNHALSIATRLDVILSALISNEGAKFVQSNHVRLNSNVSAPTEMSLMYGYHPLAVLETSVMIGGGKQEARFIPVFQRPASIYKSSELKPGAWMGEVVLLPKGGSKVSRQTLISQMRNKDGGAHPVSEAKPAYQAVANKMGLGLFAVGPAGAMAYDPPAHFATMRHLGHEMTSSLKAWAQN